MLQDTQILEKISKFKVKCKCLQCSNIYITNLYDAKKSRIGHLCKNCTHIIINALNFTREDLLKIFYYDKISGNIYHKLDTLRSSKGDIATYPHSQGYQSIFIGGKEYLAHRVIWFMETGNWPEEIDHEDHNRSNNSWLNLRETTSRGNQLNMSKKRNNSSGHTGVRLLPSGKYHAYIMVNRKQIPLGSYVSIDEAISARKKAEIEYGFHKNHGI